MGFIPRREQISKYFNTVQTILAFELTLQLIISIQNSSHTGTVYEYIVSVYFHDIYLMEYEYNIYKPHYALQRYCRCQTHILRSCFEKSQQLYR